MRSSDREWTGFESLREIRALGPEAGGSDSYDRLRYACMPKPFTPDKLLGDGSDFALRLNAPFGLSIRPPSFKVYSEFRSASPITSSAAERSSDFVTSRAGVDFNTGLSIELGLPLRSRNGFAKLAAPYLPGLPKRTAGRRGHRS
jgi:hypothetical protein